MDDMLSQEEINALLNGMDDEESTTKEHLVTDDEKDALGEISNISMGTASTTLFTLVNQKVTITTPKVDYCTWEELVENYDRPCAFVQINYKEGLDGNNLLIIKEKDAKVITDLMMGGDGTNIDGEFTELHKSAISEAMNQMIGSAATSMSSMLNKKIDINPPITTLIDLNDNVDVDQIAEFLKEKFLKVSFSMKIGDLVDSEIMQLYPIDFAKEVYESFINAKEEKEEVAPTIDEAPQVNQQENVAPQQQPTNQNMGEQGAYNNMYQMNTNYQQPQRDISAQPAQFQNFDMNEIMQQKENIDLIMDVALEVTVELGKTRKSIKEILEFTPGTILELDKLAGEPIDVKVNNKLIAKGEVVVIDENFGIRITDIIKK
ncbi:flagellar motor switch protein FliN/FliY [Natranaerovirga hydrolytica]|uniref:Flagellar motor switch protein FliN/FliY n=1 Tax=Natranaerovirga hydrolytica TaxID=680378 RepID=A0A4R1MZB5_9FIRM|nr:flagellar motor switch phosphatase FliY [Natranaerovirga hydrolytica]TCK97902.1 flagellar motor switch protein FliN/FliY [Natranaerovirga hydrolytica]